LQAGVLCLQELRRKAQSGATVCLSIHDLNLAMQACDELICIDQGQVKSQGLPEQVLSPTALQELFHTDAKLESTPSGQKAVTFFFPKDDGKP
jgi:ABC-type hemin transport system ATPase subunit